MRIPNNQNTPQLYHSQGAREGRIKGSGGTMTTRKELFRDLKETVNQAATQDDQAAAIHMLTTAKEQINAIGNTYIAEMEA